MKLFKLLFYTAVLSYWEAARKNLLATNATHPDLPYIVVKERITKDELARLWRS